MTDRCPGESSKYLCEPSLPAVYIFRFLWFQLILYLELTKTVKNIILIVNF